jgi:metallo-beta-lactamase family protein
MLRDTAHIHEKDAEFINRRTEKRRSGGHLRKEDAEGPVVPLYTMADAERTLPLFRPSTTTNGSNSTAL